MSANPGHTGSEVCRIRLLPNEAQERALRDAFDTYARLLDWLDAEIPSDEPLNMVGLHKRWYEKARRRSGLPARSVTLALKDFTRRRQGRWVEGMPLDDRLFAVKAIHTVSLLTPTGRLVVPFRVLGYEPMVPERGGAAARLHFRDGVFDIVVAYPIPRSNLMETLMNTTDTVVTRVGRVIAGMTNAAIGLAEQANPLAIIDQSIREIDRSADEVRSELGLALAERHRLRARMDELGHEHADLEEKLKVAVGAGRDDLATAGLGRQVDIEAQIAVLDRLMAAIDERIGKFEEALAAVKASRREAEERRAEFAASLGERQSAKGFASGATGAGHSLARVERAQAAASRLTGVPSGGPSNEAAELDELSRLARERAISERLRKLKGVQ